MSERPLDTLFTLLLGGGGAAGLWALLAVRTKASGDVEATRVANDAPASLMQAVATLQKELTAEAGRIVSDLRERIEALEEENRRVIARCDLAAAAHAKCEREMAEVRKELERLTFGRPIPPYELHPPAATAD